MKQLINSIVVVLIFLFGASMPAAAFKRETFSSLTVPVYEYDDADTQINTLTGVDLIYKLSTPSATPVTWLLGFDSLESSNTSAYFQKLIRDDLRQEIGLRLEVSPQFLALAIPEENRTDSDSLATRLLLGYSQSQRLRLLDKAMGRFFEIFGRYPSTVSAPYLDSFSLEYLATHYSVQTAVFTGDEKIRFVDGYHPDKPIFGQKPPYFPSRTNAFQPSQSSGDKINLVIVYWNPSPMGLGQENFAALGVNELKRYFEFWAQKDLNEFTQVTYGTDNRLGPESLKTIYPLIFKSLYDLREKLTLAPMTLGKFGDWFIARFPQTSPAYYFLSADKTEASYYNPFYQVRLEKKDNKSQLTQVAWYDPEEGEAYWFQKLQERELVLPVYNLLQNPSLAVDLSQKPTIEYWDIELKGEQDKLRLEPHQLISSTKLDWSDPKLVKQFKRGNSFIYSYNRLVQSRQFSAGVAIMALLLVLLIVVYKPWKHVR